MRCGLASFVFSFKCRSKDVHDSFLSASKWRHEQRVTLNSGGPDQSLTLSLVVKLRASGIGANNPLLRKWSRESLRACTLLRGHRTQQRHNLVGQSGLPNGFESNVFTRKSRHSSAGRAANL